MGQWQVGALGSLRGRHRNLVALSTLVAVGLVALGGAGCSAAARPTTGSAKVTVSAPQSPSGPSVPAHSTPAPTVTPLPTTGRFDYQLGGGYPPPHGVTIVTRDSTDLPVQGTGTGTTYNICYVNGFQTQGDERSFWLKKHSSLVLHRHGKPVVDPGWPDEMVLDSSTAAKRAAIAKIMAVTIARCVQKGFQAVEFDNLDSYSRSHGKLSKKNNISLATLYVKASHADGLAAGQKNTVELGSVGRDTIGFDFAVAEECVRYNECSGYTKVFGASVLDIEYTDDLRGTFARACADPQTPALTILRDHDLTTPKSKAYVYSSCN